MNPSVWHAVLLAAGQGSRMGHVPKPLITLDGLPLVARHTQAFLDAGAHSVTVVLGHHADVILPHVLTSPTVQTLRVLGEQSASVHAGLTALRPTGCSVMVGLCDMPLLTSAHLRKMWHVYTASPSDMVYPMHEGVPGHPVMLSPRGVADLHAAGSTVSGGQWRQAHPDRCLAWPTDDPAYSTDLDTPEAFDRLQSEGLRLQLPPSSA